MTWIDEAFEVQCFHCRGMKGRTIKKAGRHWAYCPNCKAALDVINKVRQVKKGQNNKEKDKDKFERRHAQKVRLILGARRSRRKEMLKKKQDSMSSDERLCREIIKVHLESGMSSITSWGDFSLLFNELHFSEGDIPQSRLLRAMAYGKRRGWLVAYWEGVGMTPFSGSAKRQRTYGITKLGKMMVEGYV